MPSRPPPARARPPPAMAEAHLLEVRGLCSGFDGVPVLREVGLHVDEGEMVAVIGSNGAGKSTLLGTLSGLVAAGAGSILLEGRDLVGEPPQPPVAPGLAPLPQRRRLFPSPTLDP